MPESTSKAPFTRHLQPGLNPDRPACKREVIRIDPDSIRIAQLTSGGGLNPD